MLNFLLNLPFDDVLEYQNMEDLNLQDDLTGLDNRNQFSISFKNSVKNSQIQCRSFSLLVLELDGFEGINKKFGRQSGDLVLTSFAKILSNYIRYRDQVFRYGGDQFTIILNDAVIASVPQIIERIQQAISESPLLLEFNISCNIGSANFEKNDNLDTLFERADHDLFRAKSRSHFKLAACSA
ncbi:GGDEF domain-containing protein [Psychromonas ossibalaenae]|uniref:GGDEF domain-containing protein n=1 Tax=Psychromonas ossibalaenae TaxID=444922 RepID=UPI00037BF94C|nr:GGDEF domain-containing protein [Psychromonas ossibalaenae]